MSLLLRRILPVAALGLATLLGGCIIDPGYGGGGYRHGWWGHERGGWEGGRR
jgi:hypothetical protein